MNHSDQYFMRQALSEAKKAKESGDYPFGAVVVHAGDVVGIDHATDHTTGDVVDHAEIRAIRRACQTLKRNTLDDCVIYCSNEPCLMCAAAIFQAKIATVLIGVSRSDVPHFLRPRALTIDDLAKDSSFAIAISRGICRDEILPLFDGLVR